MTAVHQEAVVLVVVAVVDKQDLMVATEQATLVPVVVVLATIQEHLLVLVVLE